MSNFKEITNYECIKCGKVFRIKPEHCTCYKKYAKGRVLGSFKLLEDKNSEPEVRVNCLLCGMDTLVHYANIEKQKSCGCKPRHILLLGVTEETVNYRCTKCQSAKETKLPVFQWCCVEDDE